MRIEFDKKWHRNYKYQNCSDYQCGVKPECCLSALFPTLFPIINNIIAYGRPSICNAKSHQNICQCNETKIGRFKLARQDRNRNKTDCIYDYPLPIQPGSTFCAFLSDTFETHWLLGVVGGMPAQ